MFSENEDPFVVSDVFLKTFYLNESYWNNHKTFVLMLDYDGTLANLAPHPDQTSMCPGNRELLNFIINQPNVLVAIITGRDANNAKQTIGLDNVVYAGNHGFEIHFPGGYTFNYQLTDQLKENYSKMVQELNKISEDGAWVEDKKYSLTFHYRAVPPELQKEVEEKGIKIIESMGFRASPAHMAVEARPPIDWNKGYAAEYILKKKFGDDWQSKAFALFIGDDTTDEDVMKVLRGRSLTFRVTQNSGLQTNATFKIPDTKAVTNVLQQIQKRLQRRTPM